MAVNSLDSNDLSPFFTTSLNSNTGDVVLSFDFSGALPIANGGTGAITAVSAFDNLSPMTTLGDMIYGGAAGTRTRLAGNTTDTKKFLSQTGSSGSSAAPSWVALTAGDIPDLSAAYIKNQTSQQSSSNFNISGAGEIGEILILPTTHGTTLGVIYKRIDSTTAYPFIHNFAPAAATGDNTFVGIHAGNFTMTAPVGTYQGSYNTALGVSALYANTTGYQNTAIGAQVLLANTTGYYNTAIGHEALNDSTIGYGNTAIGTYALLHNVSGHYNTAIGLGSLSNNTTGSNNIAIGYGALYDLDITADDNSGNNTVIGSYTGLGIVDGINNTIIGANVGSLAGGLTSNIIIANGTGAIKARHDGSNWAFTGPITTGVWNASAIAAIYGGTGLTSYAAGDILYASATNTLAKLAKGTDGKILTLVSGFPAWMPGTDVTAFVQGGNAFGDEAVLGTTDNYAVNIMANNTPAIYIDTDGKVTFPGTLQFAYYTGPGVLQIDASGNVSTGSYLPLSAGSGNALTGLLYAGSSADTTGAPTPGKLWVLQDNATTSGGVVAGALRLNQTASQTGGVTGLHSFVKASHTSGDINNINSIRGFINISGSGTTTAARAINGIGEFAGSGATVGTWRCFEADMFASGTNTITDAVMFYGEAFPTSGVTITNKYGVWINDATALNYFAGDVMSYGIVYAYKGTSDTVLTGGAIYMPGGYTTLRTGTDQSFNIDNYNGGAAVNALKISPAGSATFTGTANTTVLAIDNTNVLNYGGNLAIRSGGTDAGYFGTLGSLLGSTNHDMTAWATSGNGFRVYTNGNNLRLTLASGGDATFTGSVTGAAASFTTGVFSGALTLPVGIFHLSSEGRQRLYFDSGASTYIKGSGVIFQDNAGNETANISAGTGGATFAGPLTAPSLVASGAGSNTTGLGPYVALLNSSNNYALLHQLNASYGEDVWAYNGAWTTIYTLTNAGAATFAGSVTGAAASFTTGTFSGDVTVPYEAYGSGWNGSNEVPTKDAIYDKIQSITPPVLDFNTYTPTLSSTTNVASSSAIKCQWIRIGNIVIVYGNLYLTPSSAGGTYTEIHISLPVSTTFTNFNQAHGDGNVTNWIFDGDARIGAGLSTNNQKVRMGLTAISTTEDNIFFSFCYEVL